MVTKAEALLALFNAMNRPMKAGRNCVTYGRQNVEAMLDVVKQLAEKEGVKFSPHEG